MLNNRTIWHDVRSLDLVRHLGRRLVGTSGSSERAVFTVRRTWQDMGTKLRNALLSQTWKMPHIGIYITEGRHTEVATQVKVRID
jgi:hypothetical protein